MPLGNAPVYSHTQDNHTRTDIRCAKCLICLNCRESGDEEEEEDDEEMEGGDDESIVRPDAEACSQEVSHAAMHSIYLYVWQLVFFVVVFVFVFVFVCFFCCCCFFVCFCFCFVIPLSLLLDWLF